MFPEIYVNLYKRCFQVTDKKCTIRCRAIDKAFLQRFYLLILRNKVAISNKQLKA